MSTDRAVRRHLQRSDGRITGGIFLEGIRSAEIDALDLLPNMELRPALEALPEPMRMVVYYADVAGIACKEIADIMGTPLGP
jgi:RNA polymerase sigma-70 factor (ECF subfamily)